MRQYNNLITGYAKEGNTEKILECTQALETAIEAHTIKTIVRIRYHKNTAVNLILGSCLLLCISQSCNHVFTLKVILHYPQLPQ